MSEIFEMPKRYATKIYEEDDWIVLEQESNSDDKQSVAIHKYDLPELIDVLCNLAGIKSSKP